MAIDSPNRESIDKSVRRQILFTFGVLAVITELSVFFSISLGIWSEVPMVVLGFLLFGSIVAFGAYYLLVARGAGRHFLYIKIHELEGKTKEHVMKIKWPIRQILGPLEQPQQIPVVDARVESDRLFSGYYMDRYARYLKRKDASPRVVLDPSKPYVQLLYEPVEHYYFDQEALKLFDADEQGKKPEKEEDVERNPLIEKQDALYLVLLTGVAYTSTVINVFLSPKVLAASLPFLLCVFCVPFYRGYLKGSLKDDFGNRLRGWENLVLISIMSPIVSVSFWYLFPNLYLLSSVFMRQILKASWVQLFTLAVIGIVCLVFILAVIRTAVFLVRLVAVNLTKFYFDNSPSRRPDILNHITYAGDRRRINANVVLSAMLHRLETKLVLGSQLLTVQASMVDSEKFIQGSYGKGWSWFLDIYVLCLGLASTFVLLMRVL